MKRSVVVIGHWSVMVLIWPARDCPLIGQDGHDTVISLVSWYQTLVLHNYGHTYTHIPRLQFYNT